MQHDNGKKCQPTMFPRYWYPMLCYHSTQFPQTVSWIFVRYIVQSVVCSPGSKFHEKGFYLLLDISYQLVYVPFNHVWRTDILGTHGTCHHWESLINLNVILWNLVCFSIQCIKTSITWSEYIFMTAQFETHENKHMSSDCQFFSQYN